MVVARRVPLREGTSDGESGNQMSMFMDEPGLVSRYLKSRARVSRDSEMFAEEIGERLQVARCDGHSV